MHVVQFIINLVAIHYINAESRFWGVTRTMYVGMNSIALTKSRGGGGRNVVNTNDNSMDEESKTLVILIDVDNTLYSEKDLVASTRNGEGIESQIIRNTHIFGMLHFNLTSNQCDELYRKYGTTIEGLRQNLPPIQVEETMPKFYDEVYNAIDYSCLLGGKTIVNTNDVRSGYDHGTALQQKRTVLAEFLKSLSQTYPVYLASNSPYVHVRQVINCMGLAGVEFAGIVTPDMNRSNDDGCDDELIYPTKSSPQHYYKSILKRHPLSSNRIILLDDSLHNLNLAKSVGIEGIHINHSSRTLDEGLSQAVGHILPPEMVDTPVSMGERFTFSDVEYLHSKNEIDINAINPIVWDQLAHQLALRLQRSAEGVLHVADLGAGMLSMLELLLIGGGAKEREKLSILFMVKKYLKIDQPFRKIVYSAYELNLNLLEGCKDRLSRMGFHEFKADANDDALTYKLEESELTHGIEVTIHLHLVDYQEEQIESKDFDLIIGCCFADLFDPGQLAISLQRFANGKESPPLVYLPITFAGITQFHPEYPAAPSLGKLNRLIPSDTSAFRMYSDSLTNHGHNLDPTRIVSAISDYGGSLISKGSSDWIIDPTSNRKLWDTMMYFFGMSGAREIANHHFDAASWIRRCRQQPRTIQVSNVDLLLHIQDASREHRSDSASDIISPGHSHEIQFVAPYNVTTIIKTTSRLSPDQVEIESICSLISSGTELKIYRGTFDLSSSLDVNIKGMSDKSMEYPLAYGYSLVGRVVACGSNVRDAEALMGRLVFTFSPHSSRVVVDRDTIHIVPDGISAEEAVFFPSMETALSLIHDANVRMGENVAVYGQGLIGLLVTSVLSMQYPSLTSLSDCFGSITVFDALDDRLSVSRSLGATSALKPDLAAAAGPFDCSIEVSGNPCALQSAIDHTSNNGRIVVGSWYGNTEVSLKLGIDFHRSNKSIVASQVSTISPTLSGLWNKERRFSYTWALVKYLCPSRLIAKRVPLSEAQQAYELLDKGHELVICFKYD